MSAAGEDVARITHHAREAGDGAAVVRYSPLAAQEAAAASAHREALEVRIARAGPAAATTAAATADGPAREASEGRLATHGRRQPSRGGSACSSATTMRAAEPAGVRSGAIEPSAASLPTS